MTPKKCSHNWSFLFFIVSIFIIREMALTVTNLTLGILSSSPRMSMGITVDSMVVKSKCSLHTTRALTTVMRCS